MGGAGAAVGEEAVLEALRGVEDPEVPVDVVSLGLVRSIEVDGATVTVTLAPTYAACPGRAYIVERAEAALRALGVRAVVRWTAEPAWNSRLIRPEAVARLAELGVGLPGPGRREPPCPYCGSPDTRLEREFGSAVCKSLFYCDACRSPFESLRGAW